MSLGRVAKFFAHVALIVVAFLLAYELRRGLPFDWWVNDTGASRVYVWAAAYGAIGGLVELVFRTERAAWRFSSAREALAILRSTAITAGLFLALIFVTQRAIDLPRSSLLLSWMLSFLALVGIRLAWRVFKNPALLTSFRFSDVMLGGGAPVLVVGNLHDADAMVRRLREDNPDRFNVTGIVSTDRAAVGLHINGAPVLGTLDQLHDVADAQARWRPGQLSIIFLSDSVIDFGLVTEDIRRLKQAGFRLLRRPNLTELNKGAGDALREIAPDEFLSRAPVSLDPAPIVELVKGRRVLVTGAGGSIGSEISRQLVLAGCARLTLLDHSEFHLFEIDRELRGSGSRCKVSTVLGNVRDLSRLRQTFLEEKPEIVFHAAALKHVTLVEQNPVEGFLTNVVGTKNVIEAAQACGARQLTFISTDKAVQPTSIMGATKGIAEGLIASQESDTLRCCAVRFGNVLGSTGSVIPLFREQIERGGPVTITHADVERYFMTIPEAVQLVLHATALSAKGPTGPARLFVLEMGKPVKIVDLARQLIEASGLTPDVDIKIVFTGLQRGEKMREGLTAPSERTAPCGEGILEIIGGRRFGHKDLAAIHRLAEQISLMADGEGAHRAIVNVSTGICA